ncbi:hypothetical protein [Aureispira anguillae]|uniref:Uncharacterized protein n=1 Tax=Aureispira anguillae TaxID=2864201 RepID=A0A915VK88_9BACT|nr:hypothetical protein [Aureispira anguillae]BDS09536.1 hypothetical protein AsAng_0002370 [Aureispira anguillae]
MKKNPEQEKHEEEATEYESSMQLPYLNEKQPKLPEDYNATIQRLTAQLDQTSPTTTEGKTLFGTALAISFILIFVQIMEFLGYPKWMDWIHHILIFLEACIPFTVSFFLKNPKHATLIRLIGIIVLVIYLFTLF